MRLVLICFSVLASLSFWFGVQGTPPPPGVCRGKSLPLTLLPGPYTTPSSLPLRFGGTREYPRPPLNFFPTDKELRLVIKSRDEFSALWKQLRARYDGAPPLPEIDFSKEIIVVAATGPKPTSGYSIVIDGACEVDGQLEVFVSSVAGDSCATHFPSVSTTADAVRLPRTDLPVVFRETTVPCAQWIKRFRP